MRRIIVLIVVEMDGYKFVYTIVFPLVGIAYRLSYDKKRNIVRNEYTVDERDFQGRWFRTISIKGEEE